MRWGRSSKVEKEVKDYTNSQINNLIDEHIHNALHREAMKMRFIDGATYEQIAEKIDRTPRQVGYLVSKYSKKLSKYLL